MKKTLVKTAGSLIIFFFFIGLVAQLCVATQNLTTPSDLTASVTIQNALASSETLHPFFANVRGEAVTGLMTSDARPVLAVKLPYFIDSAFSEGLLKIGHKLPGDRVEYGYVDEKLNLVIPFAFNEASEFQEGLAIVSVDMQWGAIDRTGRFVFEPKYNHIASFRNGIATVCRGTKYAYVRADGSFITDFIFDSVRDFSEGLAPVGINETHRAYHTSYGFIDQNGTVVIPYAFEDARSFSEGLAPVKKEGLYGFINRNNEMVITPAYSAVLGFKDGIAPVKDYRSGLWGFINTQGQVVIPPQFHWAATFHEGLAEVVTTQDRSLHGYIDRTGKIVIPPRFSRVEVFKDGIASVEMDFITGYINTRGEWIQKTDVMNLLEAQAARRSVKTDDDCELELKAVSEPNALPTTFPSK